MIKSGCTGWVQCYNCRIKIEAELIFTGNQLISFTPTGGQIYHGYMDFFYCSDCFKPIKEKIKIEKERKEKLCLGGCGKPKKGKSKTCGSKDCKNWIIINDEQDAYIAATQCERQGCWDAGS